MHLFPVTTFENICLLVNSGLTESSISSAAIKNTGKNSQFQQASFLIIVLRESCFSRKAVCLFPQLWRTEMQQLEMFRDLYISSRVVVTVGRFNRMQARSDFQKKSNILNRI